MPRQSLQSQDAVNVFERLGLTDPNVTIPGIDTSELVATYPLDSAMIGLQVVVLQRAAASINGAALVLDDMTAGDWTNIYRGFLPGTGLNRVYRVWWECGGGTVTPIRVAGDWLFNGFLAARFFDVYQVNPGSGFAGPFFVPAGSTFQLSFAAGGVGDLAAPIIQGFAAEPGVPLPNLGSGNATTGP